VEPEEKEERGSGRSQNVVHTLPRSMASVPGFLTGPLERIDPAAGVTQLLVLTTDAESAVALAGAVLRMTGPAGIELLPVTTARRTARLMAGRPVLAAAGSPRDIRDLIRGSHLKLDSIKAVVLAWADEILAGEAGDIEAREAIMSELPREAARIVVTSRSEGRVNAFAERYLRRAHRDLPIEGAEGEPVALQYVTVSASSRPVALRRLLDDMDPPSAAVIVHGPEAEDEVSKTLRLLGYGGGSTPVRVSRGEVEPSTYAVIFYEIPSSRADLNTAVAAGPVSIVVLAEPRELATLRQMSRGDVRPFTLSAPGNEAREREVALRRELESVLDAGVASRDLLALEPLLERHDGIEIAAAALRLLEKERSLRKAAELSVRKAADAPPPPAEKPAFERSRGGPPPRGGGSPSRGPAGRGGAGPRGEAGARGGPPSRGTSPGRGGPPGRGGAPGRSGPPGRGGEGRPPRDGYTRPPRRDR